MWTFLTTRIIGGKKKGRPDEPERPSSSGIDLDLFFGVLALAALAHRLQAFFLALGPLGGALHQIGADQFENCLFGAVAFAPAETRDAGVAAGPLTEPGAQLIEQLLHRSGRHQERRRLTPGVQTIFDK